MKKELWFLMLANKGNHFGDTIVMPKLVLNDNGTLMLFKKHSDAIGYYNEKVDEFIRQGYMDVFLLKMEDNNN